MKRIRKTAKTPGGRIDWTGGASGKSQQSKSSTHQPLAGGGSGLRASKEDLLRLEIGCEGQRASGKEQVASAR